MVESQRNISIQSIDGRRDIVMPGDEPAAIQFSVEHFISIANQAISQNGRFAVALSGGSTPKAIYERLSNKPFSTQVDWTKVWLFWSDERSVPPDHPDSNFHMAMAAGFSKLSIPKNQIFRMQAESDIQNHALEYDNLIHDKLGGIFDLVMLGMGDDGHTASLFPRTHGLHSGQRIVVANFIPETDTWRMTLTYEGINKSRHIAIYIFGKKKASMLKKVLSGPQEPDILPIQGVGTPENKALFIVDQAAASGV